MRSIEAHRVYATTDMSLGTASDTLPARQLGYASDLLASHLTPEKRRELSFGQQAKILHLIDSKEREALAPGIEAAKREFWARWIRFRCGLPDEGQPVFDDVVNMLPVRGQFAQFIDPQPGDLVVDLMGGSANMAKYVAERQPDLAGYVVLDSNGFALERAQKQLKKVDVPNKVVEKYDLSKGLPPHLPDLIGKINPKRVRYVSNWGMTYVAADDFLHLVAGCFDQEVNGGLPSVLDFNMITDGNFDPHVLAERFKPVAIKAALSLQWVALSRANSAKPLIQQFGRELPGVEPIWYPEETQELLRKGGYVVERMDTNLLWGQSTAMKVSGRFKTS